MSLKNRINKKVLRAGNLFNRIRIGKRNLYQDLKNNTITFLITNCIAKRLPK